LLHEQHGARAWFRNKIIRESDLARYGLHFADGWDDIDSSRPVVILIHGFNSTPEQNAAIMLPIHEAGFPCGTFSYPNDQSLSMSVQLLSEELRRFARRYPNRRVILVCHSMGGLIARACIENWHDDPGNVSRLVMIAPPNRGTLLAHFAVGTDVWEHWLARKSGSAWRRFRDSVVDGLGEAADDMCPNSPFLNELNSRPLNSHVRYTVLLGTGGCLEEAQVCWMRKCVCEKLGKCPGAKKTSKEIDAILSDIDELVVGKGDGVVAVKRGRLDGVTDTLVMPFGHMAVTGLPRNEIVHDVQLAVLKRVQ
jgi:pimeloyl-ACP methyl ester carboxylesterase